MKEIINTHRLKKKGNQYMVCGLSLTITLMYQLLFLRRLEKANINYNTDYMKIEALIKKDLVEMASTDEEIHHRITLKGKAVIKELLK